jgi:hypothetical protein
LTNVAVAEKLSALRTETVFAERAARADIPKALDIPSGRAWTIRPKKATRFQSPDAGIESEPGFVTSTGFVPSHRNRPVAQALLSRFT